MSKQIKGLVFGGLAILALVLVLLLVRMIPEKQEEEAPSAPETPIYELTEKGQDEIQRIDVSNVKDSFSIEMKVEKAQAEGEKDRTVWYIPKVEEFETDSEMISTIPPALGSLTSVAKYENVTDLAQYGLDAPQGQTIVTYKDGTAFRLRIGNAAPGGNGYYCLTGDDDSTVYLLSAVLGTKLVTAVTSFVSTTVNVYGEEAAMEMTKVTLSGSNRPEPIEIVKLEANDPNAHSVFSTHAILSPRKADLNTDKAQALFTAFTNLSALQAVAVHVSQEDLAAYGLDEPQSIISCEHPDWSCTLRVSEKDGAYYLLKDGVDAIYQVSLDVIPWFNTQFEDLMSVLMILPHVDTVQELSIRIDDQIFVFETERSPVEDNTGTETLQVTKVTCNGEEKDLANFKLLYQLVLNSMIDSVSEGEPSQEPTMTVTYTYYDSDKQDVIEYIPAGNRKMFMSINGDASFFIREAYKDKMEAEIGKFLNDQKVNSDW